jgi:hypothetical protein
MSTAVPVAKAQGDVDVFLRPGAPDPYNPGFSHTLGTLATNPDLVIAQYLEYAILTDSVGDLQFDVMVNVPINVLRIYVPGEFSFTRNAGADQGSADYRFSVWTDITNDYDYITVSLRASDDSVAPNWYRITIGDTRDLGPTLVIEPSLYHVRLLALKAPEAFGVYHFKIFVDVGDGYVSIPVEDYPIIVVKGELNPAYIIGTVSAETNVFGKVTASGTTAEGRSVTGQFYFSPLFEDPASAGDYTYYLLGAPEGSYEVTASAGGYLPKTSSRFSVAAGQSTHGIDLSLDTGPLITITVWSKHGRGAIPWSCLWQPPYGTNEVTDQCDDSQWRSIYIHIYDEAGTDLYPWGPWSLDPEASSFTTPLINLIELAAVPWDSSEWVSGFASGATYKAEAYVTGYVMTEADAGQREFTVVGDEMTVEMDLRRSNWFEIQAHTITPNNDMTLAYVAIDSAGVEKGMAVYRVPAGTDAPIIILEGWNAATGYADLMDYGLEPGTYEIKLYAADGTPPDPVVAGAVEGTGWYYIDATQAPSGSIALCNSPSMMSFEVGSISLTLSLRSVDWQAPAHERPWTFPGAEIWVDFLDESTGESTDELLDPTVWGLVQDDGIIASPYLQPDGTLRITWTGNDVEDPADVLDATLPTHLDPGQYNFALNTFGYVTRRVFPVWVPTGGNGNIQADLIQGGMASVGVSFTKEDQDIAFNGFVRVEIYDQDGNLAGANIYGQAQPDVYTTIGEGGSYPAYNPTVDYKLAPGPAEGSNSDPDGQRGYTSMLFYGQPSGTWANWPLMGPSVANSLNLPAGETAYFDVYGFYWYYGGPSSRNEGLWANGWETTDGTLQSDHGLAGSSDITGMTGAGSYTVKVFAFDPYGPDGVWGTVDDWASYYVDPVENVELPWGGYQAVSVSLAQMGRISGGVGWLDMYGNNRNMPWATLTTGEVTSYTTSPVSSDWGLGYSDEPYFMWLPAGTHDVSVSVSTAPQIFAAAGSTVVVSDGWSAAYDQTLIPSGIPIPEFSASTLLVLLSSLGASVYLLRRRRTK